MSMVFETGVYGDTGSLEMNVTWYRLGASAPIERWRKPSPFPRLPENDGGLVIIENYGPQWRVAVAQSALKSQGWGNIAVYDNRMGAIVTESDGTLVIGTALNVDFEE